MHRLSICYNIIDANAWLTGEGEEEEEEYYMLQPANKSDRMCHLVANDHAFIMFKQSMT